MGEKAVKPTHKQKRRAPKKSPSKSILTKQNVRTVLSVADAGLAALSHIKQVAPYAHVLRIATNLGNQAVPESEDSLLKQMKVVRRQIKKLEKDQSERGQASLIVLRNQMDGYIDLLLEQV